jgi:phosphoglycolate phosphatase-like HAD superfamily hydrolase
MNMTDPAKPLKDFKPQHQFFVGIDSDGCAFDTMGIKQRECFCPWMIGYFGLQPVAQAARQCKDFADLFSKTRGANRHKTLKRILVELLPTHPMVISRQFKVQQLPNYFAWVDAKGSLLSDAGLKQEIANATDPQAKKEFELVLAWSKKVNESIKEIVKEMPPFPYVRESLDKMKAKADLIVVSQTPTEALTREWAEHKIDNYVAIIAGQEMGTKTEHIKYAAVGKYPNDKILMIGDAPGDMKAAKSNNALFFPINPGHEDESWKRLYDEAFDKFVSGTYAGDYEQKLIKEFDACLPEHPNW